MYVGYSGATSMCTWELVVQGPYIFKNSFFKKSFSVMAWKNLHVREPNARYACMVQFRVITLSGSLLLYFILDIFGETLEGVTTIFASLR
jgi:hypothetical protein